MRSKLTSVKENVKKLTVDDVKSNISSTYTAVRSLSVEDVTSRVKDGRAGLVNGVWAGVDGVTAEVGALASETLKPTVNRYTTAKQYTVDKVTIRSQITCSQN